MQNGTGAASGGLFDQSSGSGAGCVLPPLSDLLAGKVRREDDGEDRGALQRQAITFEIPGTPVGKGRPKFARRGTFVTAYTPEKTAAYENLVKLAAAKAMQGKQLFDGPVDVSIMLRVVPPAGWSKRKTATALAWGIMPTVKPDLDNVGKIILDGCNGIVWKDDKQVCSLTVSKHYSETASAIVRVEKMEAAAA